MIYLYWFLFSIWGAFLYRWRGHASKYKKYFPRPFNQIAFALPYAFIAYQVHWGYAVLTLAVTTAAILSGHGNFFFSGRYGKEPEKLEYLILWMRDIIPMNLYKFIGMVLSGVSISALAGIVSLNPFIALSGGLKGLAYYISYKAGYGTGGGEILTGLFLYWSLFGIATFL